MITGDVIFDLPYYDAGGIFTGGNIYGPRYRIAKITIEQEPETEGGEAETKKLFQVHIWNGSTCFEKTPEELFRERTFPFDAQGRESVLAWLNEELAK